MYICHDSHNVLYRKPFGACSFGKSVTLSIDINDAEIEQVELRIWLESKGTEQLFPMKKYKIKEGFRYSIEFKPKINELHWYSFKITFGKDWSCFYGPKEGCIGGEGKVYECSQSSYQLTVYKETKLPDWYRKGIVYQIFPDSFYRGSGKFNYLQLPDNVHKNGPKREFREWNESPRYKRTEDGGIDTWCFYGGTLKGIEERLTYIKELGATIIYLNPIFMAASSHRYDTADYTKIDPLLGTEEDFKSLCKQAKKLDMHIILDGVFNHTGCDSLYFNKYKNFGDGGAFNDVNSEYYKWYNFNDDGTYSAWWGNLDLPDLNEHNESYREYVCGDNGVVQKWLRLGASGWRLDVADELPDDFIVDIRKAAKNANRDAVLLGEVWEDASNKRAYGELRRYFNGEELDCVMNYPFQSAIIDFLIGNINAEFFVETIINLQENYPRQAFFGNLNMLSSHDRMRVITALGEAPNPNNMSEDEQADYRLNDDQYKLAVARCWLAILAQATFPGVPSIYYGDEVGMQGFRDPFNRASHLWDNGDVNIYNMYCNAMSMRKIFLDHCTEGNFSIKSYGSDVLIWSWDYNGEHIDIVINRSRYDYCRLELKKKGEFVDDLINGRCNVLDNDNFEINLTPLGSAFIVHHDKSEIAADFERGSGVLCHITSLPDSSVQKSNMLSRKKILPEKKTKNFIRFNFDEVKDYLGTFDDGYEFVDFLEKAGQKYWQILPLNPTDFTGSPYSGTSAFAGNLRLMKGGEIKLRNQFNKWKAGSEFKKFVNINKAWLYPYATYMAVKNFHNDAPVWKWKLEYRRYSEELIKDKLFKNEAKYHMFAQFRFFNEWFKLKNYANKKGIKIVGDIPMFVNTDSADVWANPQYFTINNDATLSERVGVPPDDFCPDGQDWRVPAYRWDVLREDGYSWWVARIKKCLQLYDILRIDHFRGFESFWEIAPGKDASCGAWKPGPGIDFFNVLFEKFGKLPMMPEDLGLITPSIRYLMMRTGFPSMDVLQFADGDPAEFYRPAVNKVAYTGTHDNMSTLSWCMSKYNIDSTEGIAKLHTLCHNLYFSKANVVFLPLQDLLELDDRSRMNIPSSCSGNWTWRAEPGSLSTKIINELSLITKQSKR